MKPSLEQVIDRMEELGDEKHWRGNNNDENFEDYSKFCESNESKLGWIWRKGVCLGKTMVFTSLVVSSTSFVIPPLVALSAIGVTLSLPVGVMFATYACTDKLMNTLLPLPPCDREVLYLESVPMSLSNDDEEDDIGVGVREDEDDGVGFEEDMRNELEKGIELTKDEDDRDIRDEVINLEIVEEEQILDSTAIPPIMEGIREAEADVSRMEREGVEVPKDSLSAFLVEAEVGGRNEDDVEHVTEELVFVPSRDDNVRVEDANNEGINIVEIDEDDELRNETTGLLERIRDEGKNEHGGGIEIEDDARKKDEKISVIPEEVKPVGEPSQVVIERTVVLTTDIDQGTNNLDDGKTETLILSEVDVMEIGDERGFDDETRVVEQLVDSLSKGDDVATGTPIDVSIDYHEIRIEPKHGETGVDDEEDTTDSDKKSVNEGKIWDQIHAIRTIIGYKTDPHASCMDELEALYTFTGIELPVSSKEAVDVDLGDINDKLHLLMSIVGVK